MGNRDVRSFYKFEVLPENQCRGMQVWSEEQGHNCFVGFVRYAVSRKQFYLTTDDITYVAVDKAFNIEPIDSDNP